jgi:aminoglycoside phosphotransferase (APT) family kinase protein
MFDTVTRRLHSCNRRENGTQTPWSDAAQPSPSPGTPVAEFALDNTFVAGLLVDQHPDLAHLPLQAVEAGWDNALFRLGDDLAVRLPRRAMAAPLILHEQRWLPHLTKWLTLPIPAPVRVGIPALGYPWHWSVVPWLTGMAADQHEPDPAQARPLAAFLRSLHVSAPAEAPANPFRGVPLSQRAATVEARMQRLASTSNLITPQIRRIWQAAVQVPLDLPPTWLHGDLHPRNVLVEHGVITGIIDWGDLTAGDLATDLASIWMLFADPDTRQQALTAYGDLSDATLQRARGWAVLFGVMLLDSGLIDNPRNAVIGAQTLQRVGESSEIREQHQRL